MRETYISFSCARCGRKAPVRKDSASKTARCPICGYEASSSSEVPIGPPLAVIGNRRSSDSESESSPKVPFFCAQNGAEFFVLFKRTSAGEKFRITSIDIVPQLRTIVSRDARAQMRSQPHLKTFSANEFDVSGWQCPYCRHGASAVKFLFVKCAKCNRLVCGSRVISISNGPNTFHCTPECSGSGVLSGEIENYDAKAALPDQPRGSSEFRPVRERRD